MTATKTDTTFAKSCGIELTPRCEMCELNRHREEDLRLEAERFFLAFFWLLNAGIQRERTMQNQRLAIFALVIVALALLVDGLVKR